jgi:hypothetical protein
MKKTDYPKLVCLFLLSLILFFSAGITETCAAQSNDYPITLTEEKHNYMIDIYWEKVENKPDVLITAPDGTQYSLANMPESDTGKGEFFFLFETAMAGKWNVHITGENLGKLNIQTGVMPNQMTITNFNVKISGKQCTYSWKIEDNADNPELQVWITSDPKSYGGKMLNAQHSKLSSGEAAFNLNGMDTGDYYFYLKAVSSLGTFSRRYADAPVHITAQNAPAKLQNVKACLLDDDVWITWPAVRDINTFHIVLRNADTGEVLSNETVKDENEWYGSFSKDISSVTVSAAAVKNNVTGDYDTFTLKRSSFDGVSVTFPEKDNLNTKSISVNVAFTGSCTVSAVVNDVLLCTDSAKSGDYAVTMAEGNNRIVFYVTDSTGNKKSFIRELHVDTTPPQLSVLKDLDKTTTAEDHVYLEGQTENGAVLKLNDAPVETQNGYFLVKNDLKSGKNTLKLTSEDAAGNQAVYLAEVTRDTEDHGFLLKIICGAVALILAILYLLVFILGRRKPNK